MKNRVIYIANKERKIIHLLEFLFISKGGYDIKSFTTTEELHKGLINKPDILVLGNSIFGTELMEELNQYTEQLPVIILSNNKDENNEVLFDKENFCCINQTGFFIDKIMETVETVLQN